MKLSVPATPRRQNSVKHLPPSGPLALPGKYTVTLTKEAEGKPTDLGQPVPFKVMPLELGEARLGSRFVLSLTNPRRDGISSPVA